MKDDIEFAKLGELTKIKTGKLDANAADAEGEFPFFTCATTPLRISSFSYDCECVLVAGNGDLNVKYYNGKFDAYQRTYIIENKSSKLYMPYLYHFMNNYIEVLRRQAIGGVIKYIKLENLTNIIVPLPRIEKQKEIARKLGVVSTLIEKNKAKSEKYDDIVKSQFSEMFGRGIFIEKQLSEVSKIKSGFTIGLHKENEGGKVMYVKVADMNLPGNEKYLTTSTKYVSEQTASHVIIQKNSIVFPKNGEAVGTNKKRITTQETTIDLNTMAVIPDKEIINLQYLYTWFENLDLMSIASGSTIPTISVKKMGKQLIKVPPIDLQNQFADFVKHIEKLKSAIKKSVEKLELCYQSLLKECFE